jgi:hypothetical protein
MPKITISSAFAKTGEDIKDGDIIKILNAGEQRPSPRDAKKMVWNFQIETVDGLAKLMTFNNTSLRALTAKWGDNSDKWVGKMVMVEVMKQMVGNERKEVAYLTPADDEDASKDIEEEELDDIPVVNDEN